MATFTKGTNNASSTLTGDQVIVEVQEILQGDGFGLFQMFADGVQNGYTFTYKTPERIIPETYDRTTDGAFGQGGVVSQVDIHADIEDVAYLELEDMEFNTQVEADAEKSRLANSMVQSIMAQLDAEILTELKDGASQGTGKVVGFTEAKDRDEIQWTKVLLGDVIADNSQLVDAKTLGVPSTRQLVLLSPKAYWRYINSFGTNVVSQSDEIKRGDMTIRKINGSIIISHPLIGKSHVKGTLHKNKAYDLSTDRDGNALEGFVLTDVAAGFPMIVKQVRQRINKLGNDEIISKYKYGKGLIRPGLVKMIIASSTSTGTGSSSN